MNPIAIWRKALDPEPILSYPLWRPCTTLMGVEDRLGAVQNYLSALNADDADHGFAVANMAVDFTFSILAHLGLEDENGPTPPIITLLMAQLAISNLRAVVRRHLEAWQRAALGDDEPNAATATQDESDAPPQDKPDAATLKQNEPDVAPTHVDKPEAAASEDLVIDEEMFTIYYKGKTCELGNTVAFRLFVRLAEGRRPPVSHQTLADEVWGDDQTLNWAIHTQVKLLKKKLRAAGIDGIVIEGKNGHYRLILR